MLKKGVRSINCLPLFCRVFFGLDRLDEVFKVLCLDLRIQVRSTPMHGDLRCHSLDRGCNSITTVTTTHDLY